MGVDAFFDFIGGDRSPYADALFKLIDADGSGTIDFQEMIQVLATYCLYSKEDILTCEQLRVAASTLSMLIIYSFGQSASTPSMSIRAGKSMRSAFHCIFRPTGFLRVHVVSQKEFIALCKAVNNANPMFGGNFKTMQTNFDRYSRLPK